MPHVFKHGFRRRPSNLLDFTLAVTEVFRYSRAVSYTHLNAPISGFVTVLNGNLRGLACVLNAIAEQKQSA